MNRKEAETQLSGKELIPYVQGPITSIKQLQEKCLRANIPVLLDGDGPSGNS